jgi:hypothetical protein
MPFVDGGDEGSMRVGRLPRADQRFVTALADRHTSAISRLCMISTVDVGRYACLDISNYRICLIEYIEQQTGSRQQSVRDQSAMQSSIATGSRNLRFF